MILLQAPSILEWVLMGVGALALIIYGIVTFTHSRKKKKQEKEEDKGYE